jgi:hypothetical protein
MSDRDYYEILGLTPRADGAMVDQAYWHLVRKYQALAATNARAQYMIDELNEAYGVLGNPRLREQYDAFRDDVLIRRGMVQPVPSKPKPRREKAAEQAPAPEKKHRRKREGPLLPLPQHWRTYAVSAVISLLAFAAAWQGVNIVLVVVALAAGLGFSLTPTLTRRISEISFEMPQVSMPAVKAPKIDLPKVSELPVPALKEFAARGEEGVDADTLSRSTRDTIARWRKSVGLGESLTDASMPVDMAPPVAAREPEKPAEEEDGAAFNAVMDILRSGAKASPERTRS